MSEHMLWETIDEQKRKIADLEQDLKHKKIAIRSRKAKIKELEETCKDLSDKFDFQVKRVMQLEQRFDVAKEIIREYILISLTKPDKRDMLKEIELFKKANAFWGEIQNGI